MTPTQAMTYSGNMHLTSLHSSSLQATRLLVTPLRNQCAAQNLANATGRLLQLQSMRSAPHKLQVQKSRCKDKTQANCQPPLLGTPVCDTTRASVLLTCTITRLAWCGDYDPLKLESLCYVTRKAASCFAGTNQQQVCLLPITAVAVGSSRCCGVYIFCEQAILVGASPRTPSTPSFTPGQSSRLDCCWAIRPVWPQTAASRAIEWQYTHIIVCRGETGQGTTGLRAWFGRCCLLWLGNCPSPLLVCSSNKWCCC